MFENRKPFFIDFGAHLDIPDRNWRLFPVFLVLDCGHVTGSSENSVYE